MKPPLIAAHPYASRLAQARHRFGGAWAMYRAGRAFGYPVCCAGQFAFDVARGEFPAALRDGTDEGFVPCSFHTGRMA